MIRTRPDLAAIPDYVPGRSAESVERAYAIRDVVKLASNEAPFGPLPAALAAIAEAAPTVNRYPDDGGVALREALGEHYGVGLDNPSWKSERIDDQTPFGYGTVAQAVAAAPFRGQAAGRPARHRRSRGC